MRTLWIKALCTLALVWSAVAGITMWERSARPTPETIARFLDANPVQGKPEKERRRVIDAMADQWNRLEFEQRREVRKAKETKAFLSALSSEERSYYLERTVPEGFQQMMSAISKMTPEKRMQFVAKAMFDMHQGGATPPRFDDPNVQKIMTSGLKAFYREANPESKLDLAPLIDEMQRNLTGR
jgi:hypothetical protein